MSRLQQALDSYNANVGAQMESGRMFQDNLRDRVKDLGIQEQESDDNELSMVGMHFFGDKIKSWLSNKLSDTIEEKVGGEAGQVLKNLIKDPAGAVKDALRSAGEKVMSKASDALENVASQAQDLAGSAVDRATGALEDVAGQASQAVQGAVETASGLAGRATAAAQDALERASGLGDLERGLNSLDISDETRDLVRNSLTDNDAYRQLYRQKYPDRPELSDDEAQQAREETRDNLERRGKRARESDDTPDEEPDEPPSAQAPELQSGTPDEEPSLSRGVGRNMENLQSESQGTPRLTTTQPQEADTPTQTTTQPQVADTPTETTEAPPVEAPPEVPMSDIPEGAELSELGDLEFL